MKLTRSFVSLSLVLALSLFSFLSLSVQNVNAQDAKIAIQRGYRTGYSDGYMSGYRDAIESSAKNHAKHGEYSKADRAFSKDYGTLEDYRDGYQQGFESGYDTGFDKRSFDATLPIDLKKRGIVSVKTQIETPIVKETIAETKNDVPPVYENTSANQQPILKDRPVETSYNQNDDAIIVIPVDTELIVELIDDLSTERNREGDKFTARIVSPSEISGAIIEGRVGKIIKPGRIKRRSEMVLSFDRIILNEARWSNLNAVLTEVLPVKGDNVKRVDPEGTVEGKSSLKEDSIKVGAATGTGLVVGAVAGGPVGAAVGASVGAAFGVGAVVIERGKHIRLNKAQQLRVKTAYETQIR